MNKFMRQLLDPAQTKGREGLIRSRAGSDMIAFRALIPVTINGNRHIEKVDFFIDTSRVNYGGDPVIRSPRAERHRPLGHENHIFNDHSLCLGTNLGNADLSELLRRCEEWAGGIIRWENGEKFPPLGSVFQQ